MYGSLPSEPIEDMVPNNIQEENDGNDTTEQQLVAVDAGDGMDMCMAPETLTGVQRTARSRAGRCPRIKTPTEPTRAVTKNDHPPYS
ncbi:unnamed protein product [Phytophthora fragariaefolia]|uniref:Unnamed protein product n=1 Tax=Phytophthora fragariaefolia TaxID=1490495 RepID=A0A9W6XZA6_9STRA|nr:unnamed protein product [Phytophthora fragariaefolia]